MSNRELVQEPDKTKVEIAFKRIKPDNLYPAQRPILESLRGYYEWDGCLSAAQIAMLMRFKQKHDRAERSRRSFNQHLNHRPKWAKYYDPAKPIS